MAKTIEIEPGAKVLVLTLRPDGSIGVKGNCVKDLVACYYMLERAKDIVRELDKTPIEESRIQRVGLVIDPLDGGNRN